MDQNTRPPCLDSSWVRTRFKGWRRRDLDEQPLFRSVVRPHSKDEAAERARLRIPHDHPDIPF